MPSAVPLNSGFRSWDPGDSAAQSDTERISAEARKVPKQANFVFIGFVCSRAPGSRQFMQWYTRKPSSAALQLPSSGQTFDSSLLTQRIRAGFPIVRGALDHSHCSTAPRQKVYE